MQDEGKPDAARPGDAIVEKVRERYGKIAEGTLSGCCGPTPPDAENAQALALGYQTSELCTIPEGANLGLGCGAPVSRLGLLPGETVVDLGSGGGIDCFLAASFVGASGRVIGVDMTEEMLARARSAAAAAGLGQVEFRLGRLEALPVADGSADAVTSNCVINLVPDKAAVYREIARILRPGGRVVISDIVLDGSLPAAVTREVTAWVGCIAGALGRGEYFEIVERSGLKGVTVLEDRDYLLVSGGFDALPADLRDTLDRQGVRPRDLAGVVRSITFRAVRS